MNITDLEIKQIKKDEALELIFQNHYSKIMPKLTKYYLGGFLNNSLVGVITLGWGVRPLHTIKCLFPSLEVDDYFEIGKMCMLETMPKNSESVFLSKVIKWIKLNTDCKVLFTWADGILGKPGYVYQAANFKYGGFIWTDLYISDTGEKVHPRTAQGLNEKGKTKYGHRPSPALLFQKGWSHYRGKQFRYIFFTSDKKIEKQLLLQSKVQWNLPYPKQKDLEWKLKDLQTKKWHFVSQIQYNPKSTTMINKTVKRNSIIVDNLQTVRKFFNF